MKKALCIVGVGLIIGGAATIIRDSVETIRENVKVSANTNNEIDGISAELDKMLRGIKIWEN